MSFQPGNAAIFYVKATSTAPVSGDKSTSIKSADVSKTSKMVDTTVLGGDGYGHQTQVLKDFTVDVAAFYSSSDTPLGLLLAAELSGATTYVSVITDPSAASSSEMGKTYPVKVSEVSFKNAADGLIELSIKCVGDGAPIAVIAP